MISLNWGLVRNDESSLNFINMVYQWLYVYGGRCIIVSILLSVGRICQDILPFESMMCPRNIIELFMRSHCLRFYTNPALDNPSSSIGVYRFGWVGSKIFYFFSAMHWVAKAESYLGRYWGMLPDFFKFYFEIKITGIYQCS